MFVIKTHFNSDMDRTIDRPNHQTIINYSISSDRNEGRTSDIVPRLTETKDERVI